MSNHLRTAFALAASLAVAPGLGAQTTIVDEGTFRLSLRGSPIGTETFSIRRSGDQTNATTVAQGRVVLDTGEQTRALLQVRGPELRPTAYKIEVTGPEKQSITGQAAGNRFRATIVSTSGEQMREYLASEGAVVLDEGVAHQYYFLVSDRANGQVPIIIPRQSRQISARVVDAGQETISIADQEIQARRIRVEPDGLPHRIVWVDDRGRVLRLRIPDERYTAERTSLP
jgi:hypothetical protein